MSGGGINNPYGYDGFKYNYDPAKKNLFRDAMLKNPLFDPLYRLTHGGQGFPTPTPTPTPAPAQNAPYVPQYQALPQQQYTPQQPYGSPNSYNQGIASVVDIYNSAANQALNNSGITALPTQQKQSSE